MEPYSTCKECVVKDWCGRRDGSHSLPQDYAVNPECSGYVLLEQAIKLAGIPLEFKYANKRNYKFDHDNIAFKETLQQVFNRVDDLVKKGVNIVIFHPNKGTGKTRTATTVANEYIYKNVMNPNSFNYEDPLVMYIKYGKWANDIRQMYQIDDKDYNLKILKQIEKMKKVPLLILDDMGSGRLTPIIRDLTYDVVDYRKEHCKTTVYTSNFTLNELSHKDMLDDLIVSRIRKDMVLLDMGGKDRRLTD